MTARAAAAPVDSIRAVADLLRQAAKVAELGELQAAIDGARVAVMRLERLRRNGAGR